MRKLDRGEMVLGEGHETPGTSVLDADWTETLDMPSSSPWPVTLAVMLGLMFTMLLIGQPIVALIFIGLAALVLAAWHSKEPEAA